MNDSTTECSIEQTHSKLYSDLLVLVEKNDAFEMKEIVKDNLIYRIFNYRLASYTDFLEPGAMEARGIMFEVNEAGDMIRLASRPFKKFFNYNENPMTIGLDLTKVVSILDKADGTMLSTYWHINRFGFKTRKMLDVAQIWDADKWIYADENKSLFYWTAAQTGAGRTVIFEWTAPDNRIVLEYKEPKLIVLGVRDNLTGEEIPIHDEEILNKYFVDPVFMHKKVIPEYLENILPKSEGIEGVVAIFEDNQRVKFKTEWYQLRHGTIDLVLTPVRLFNSILDEKYDELKVINKEIPYLLEKIEKMYSLVRHYLREMTSDVEESYKAFKELDRKSYAIQLKDRKYFGLMMAKYLGQEVNYKKAMQNLWKDQLSKNFSEKEYMGSVDE